MTKQEAAIVGAYTGFLLGDFGEMHAYIERLLGRPVFTHELANPVLLDQIRELAKPDFIALEVK